MVTRVPINSIVCTTYDNRQDDGEHACLLVRVANGFRVEDEEMSSLLVAGQVCHMSLNVDLFLRHL